MFQSSDIEPIKLLESASNCPLKVHIQFHLYTLFKSWYKGLLTINMKTKFIVYPYQTLTTLN